MLVTDFNVKNSRIGLVFSVIGILNLIAAILLFAAGRIVATHQAWVWGCWGTYTYGGFGFNNGGCFGGW
jgi:hypothetical protein